MSTDENAAVPVHATASAPIRGLTTQLAIVALVVPSYFLSTIVTVGVTVRGRILAVVVAVEAGV